MITKRKVVLLASEAVLKDITYEAIKLVTDVADVRDVWKRNKTPLIQKGTQAAECAKEMYECVSAPEFIFGEENFISFCHKNGFECGELNSGKKFNTAKDRCFLCGIANHMGIKENYLFNRDVERDSDMIMYESENFFVKVEYGCLKKGMLMINPKKHILSAASIPDEEMEEYKTVCKDVEFILKSIYGNKTVLFFEHGSAPDGFSSHKRSIVHAHTHVAWDVEFPDEYKEMVCLRPCSLEKLKGRKYLSYQEGTKGKFMAVWDPDVYVQRQYPRQVIGLLEGIPDELTNWRKEPFEENMKATFEDWFMYLKENEEFLSSRIQKATHDYLKGYLLRNK